MDEEIYELLQNTYGCKIRKVRITDTTVTVQRKKKIGIKKKVLGIFPIYEYERWEENLSRWTYTTLRLRNRFTGRVAWSGRIAICYDRIGDTCYWRYA